MEHERGSLTWYDAPAKNVRSILMRAGIASTLWTVAFGHFKDPNWDGGPHLYLIDSLTDKGALVTVQGPEEFDVKISSRTGTELLDELHELGGYGIDKVVILG
jgi:hypothetical protein